MLYEGMIIDNTYQITREIGSGGMGVVYLAYHLRLQKYVVMKKIKNSLADISMLRNEVDVLKSLHHPYLPQVYDFIEYDSYLYTIIDYIDGYDFNYYIKCGYVFSESQIIKWLRQLCEVLSYLHSHNILHTDIKPGNIIITAGGDICLIDFGISLNNTDVIKGLSKNYSSPEQYRNFMYLKYGTGEYSKLDERTDIYSLGATFYHIITGVQPVLGDKEMPPVSEYYNLNISEQLAEIIDKAMQFEPEKRYKSTAVMLKAINNIKKEDIRYKRYLLIQILASVICGVMVISGIADMIGGYRMWVNTSYETEYSELLNSSKSGDASIAVERGRSILNNPSYSSLVTNSNKAKILHIIGDCYYDNSDYLNATYYYKSALYYSSVEDSKIYYRDYAFALVNDNKINEAQGVIEQIRSKYGGSPEILLVNAEIAYRNGNYKESISSSEEIINKFPNDNENYYTACVVLGDSYNATGDYARAAEIYSQARAKEEDKNIINKEGNAYIKCASSLSYQKALECFKKIYNEYSVNTDDIVNLAQCYILCADTQKYEECKKILIEYSENSEDCRIFVMLAIIANLTNDARVREYCIKAHTLYLKLTVAQKELIDESTLSEIKALYFNNVGQEW